jgi:pyruvate,orthophosphate dikinase
MGERPIYGFDEYGDIVAAFGKDKLVSILGRKGAILSELSTAGLPVPKGFTITSTALRGFFSADPPALPDDLWGEITRHVTLIQETTERTFGAGEKPFLLAIRNSCEVSMEQSVLSLFQIGLNEETVNVLAATSESPKFFWTLYLRWIQHYATDYLECDPEKLAEPVTALITEKNVQSETELEIDDMKILCASLKDLLETEGTAFPEDPLEQLKASIEKVLLSWNSEQAVEFKSGNDVQADAPIALCIMIHVWTNLGDACAIGSTLTRNPSNGDPGMVGSYVANVTGADYIAKTKPPQPIGTLEGVSQVAFEKLLVLNKQIEKYYKSVAEIDFIIENGEVYFLSSKPVHGNIVSNLKLNVDFVHDDILTKEETVQKLTTEDFQFLTSPFFKPEDLENSAERQIAKGQAVSPGYIVGQICLTGEKAEELASQEQDAILILDKYAETENAGLVVSRGYISAKDKVSSLAASVARQQKIAAVFRCKFTVDVEEGTVTFGEKTLREGDFVSIDGKSGTVYSGQVPITRINPEENAEIQQILTWADEIRHGPDVRKSTNSGPTTGLLLYANADSVEAVQRARSLGAEGIGLFRTDQFLLGERTDLIQRFLLSDDQEERDSILQELEEGLTADFAGVIDTVSGFPSVLRLADPSIQEYLPNLFDLIEEVTIMQIKKQKGADVEPEELQERQKTLERIQTYYEDKSHRHNGDTAPLDTFRSAFLDHRGNNGL